MVSKINLKLQKNKETGFTGISGSFREIIRAPSGAFMFMFSDEEIFYFLS